MYILTTSKYHRYDDKGEENSNDPTNMFINGVVCMMKKLDNDIDTLNQLLDQTKRKSSTRQT